MGAKRHLCPLTTINTGIHRLKRNHVLTHLISYLHRLQIQLIQLHDLGVKSRVFGIPVLVVFLKNLKRGRSQI